MALIRNGLWADDSFIRIAADEALPETGDVALPLDRFIALGNEVAGFKGRIALILPNSADPEKQEIAWTGLAAAFLHFPKIGDGRAYSQARTLRVRLGFKGEIRATGATVRDQYGHMIRLGINAVEVPEGVALEDWTRNETFFSGVFQPSADGKVTVFERRQRKIAVDPSLGDPLADGALRDRLSRLPAESLLAHLIGGPFKGRIALVSSFGTEAAVLLHMISRIDPATPIVFLDTGKLFPETLRYRDLLIAHLGLTQVQSITPDAAKIEEEDADGMLFSRNPDRCCFIRKVEPLARALKPYDAWINGRKRFQGGAREGAGVLEDEAGKLKITPLAHWTEGEIDAYFARHGLPPHPLQDEGFLSVGCMPCTGRASAEEGRRSGRWRGQDKTECGIHNRLAVVLGAE